MTLVLFGVLLPKALWSTGGLKAVLALPPSYFDVFAYGGVSFFVGGVIFGGGVVFVTMEIWQRVYASVNGKAAQWALATSVGLIIGFYLLSTFLGMVTKTVDPNLEDRNQALFVLMTRVLPSGFLGLGIAAFMAAFISSVNTMIMVSSATITKDFYKGWINSRATDRQLLLVARISTVAAGALAYALALAVRDIVALSVNALFMLLVLLPAVVGGFFWARATATGSIWSIAIGFMVMVIALPYAPETAFVPGFVASLLVFVGVSLSSSHSPCERRDLWSH
jgi:SSS family solute:Na+ symporter